MATPLGTLKEAIWQLCDHYSLEDKVLDNICTYSTSNVEDLLIQLSNSLRNTTV